MADLPYFRPFHALVVVGIVLLWASTILLMASSRRATPNAAQRQLLRVGGIGAAVVGVALVII